MSNTTDTNQASEDELKERIGNLHAYNFDGDDVTVKVMVDEDILESIAEYVGAIIRTEKLKLLAEVRKRVVGAKNDLYFKNKIPQTLPEYMDNVVKVREQIREDQRVELDKLEAEL